MALEFDVGPYTSRRFGVCQLQGRTLVDFTSWDVFELGRNRGVIDAIHREVEIEGVGGSSPRVLGGYSPALHSAEVMWSRFMGVESAMLVSSKNQALFSLITQRLGSGGEILMFAGGASPVADLAELCGASCIPVSEGGVRRVLRELSPRREGVRRIFFLEVGHPFIQFDVDYVDLLEQLATEGIELIVDETFSLGILGNTGGGLFDQLNIPYSRQVGIAGLDGVLGIPSLALLYGSRDSILDVRRLSSVIKLEPPPTPMIAAASEAACRQVQLLGVQRVELAEKVRGFGGLLSSLLGIRPLIHNNCCITLRMPSFSVGLDFQRALILEGYLCGVFQTTLERNQSCIVQFVVSVFHSEQVLQSAARVISRVFKSEAV